MFNQEFMLMMSRQRLEELEREHRHRHVHATRERANRSRPLLHGATVLITGCSGIGRALSVALARRARALVLLARRSARLE
jgi:phosphoglycerate dehydrogenase-like enzyme